MKLTNFALSPSPDKLADLIIVIKDNT